MRIAISAAVRKRGQDTFIPLHICRRGEVLDYQASATEWAKAMRFRPVLEAQFDWRRCACMMLQSITHARLKTENEPHK